MIKKLSRLFKSTARELKLRDEIILKKIQTRFKSVRLDPFMELASKIGSVGMVWIPPAFILLDKNARKNYLLKHVGGYGLNVTLKYTIKRKRPGTSGFGYSFPSGHSMGTALGFLTYTNDSLNNLIWTLPLGFSILLSRLYLNKHYPSDVLAGLIEGALIFLL